MRVVAIVLGLVGVATVVAAFARRISVPAPSLLVVAGLVVGLIPGVPVIQATPDLVSLIVLPPLLYAAGEELSARELARVWRPVTVLSIGLVLASAAAVGVVAALTVGLPPTTAFLLGAVLASTDPVAVTALGRRLSLPPRLQTLVQAESLFNDATSLILFRLAVGFVVVGGGVTAGHVAAEFALLAFGGAAAGIVVAAGVALVRRRTEDPIIETVISLLTPYVAYVVAESVHASGVTAVVVASVILGVLSHRLTTARTRLQVMAVNHTVVFVLESVVFALIGLALPDLIRRLSTASQGWILPALAIAATLIVVRVAWVFPLSMFQHWRISSSWQVPAVVSWAGARGVVPLAAVLSIPFLNDAGQPVPYRDLVLVLATAVIVISLVVQGFTLAPLVRRAGLAIPAAQAADEVAEARVKVAEAGLRWLDQQPDLESDAIERLRLSLEHRVDRLRDGDDAVDGTDPAYRRLRRGVLAAESDELRRLYGAGAINESTRRRVQHQLDLDEARFGQDPTHR